jgi:Enoyl-(Acyl carrier protein) reductase
MNFFDATSSCLAAGRRLARPLRRHRPGPGSKSSTPPSPTAINPAAADLAVKYSEITASRTSLPRKPSFFAQARGRKTARNSQQFCDSLLIIAHPSKTKPKIQATWCSHLVLYGCGIAPRLGAHSSQLPIRRNAHDDTVPLWQFRGSARLDNRHTQFGHNDLEPARQQTLNRIPIGRSGTVTEIANGIVFLAPDDARFMTGAGLVGGGISASGSTCAGAPAPVLLSRV